MDELEIEAALQTVFDDGLIYQGHVDYLRDYEMYFYRASHDYNKIPHQVLRYLFKYCVDVSVTTSLSPQTWKTSLDDKYLGDPALVDPIEGWFWGTRYADVYPGGSVVKDSEKAAQWTRDVGISFHEVLLRAPPIEVRIVFSELIVTHGEPGTTPFEVPRPSGT